jgi:hypothetical protein
VPLVCIYLPRSACLMSCDRYLLMSESSRLPFSVAKFVIKGDGEGMRCTQPVHPVPLCLSNSQMLPLPMSQTLFNCFSIFDVPTSDSDRLTSIALSQKPSTVSNVVPLFPDVFSIASPNYLPTFSSTVAHNILIDPFSLPSNSVPKLLPNLHPPCLHQIFLFHHHPTLHISSLRRLRKVSSDWAITQSPLCLLLTASSHGVHPMEYLMIIHCCLNYLLLLSNLQRCPLLVPLLLPLALLMLQASSGLTNSATTGISLRVLACWPPMASCAHS